MGIASLAFEVKSDAQVTAQTVGKSAVAAAGAGYLGRNLRCELAGKFVPSGGCSSAGGERDHGQSRTALRVGQDDPNQSLLRLPQIRDSRY